MSYSLIDISLDALDFLVDDNHIELSETPVSIRELDSMVGTLKDDCHVADPCPYCGGFLMSAMDYLHMGCCTHCWT